MKKNYGTIYKQCFSLVVYRDIFGNGKQCTTFDIGNHWATVNLKRQVRVKCPLIYYYDNSLQMILVDKFIDSSLIHIDTYFLER